MEEVLLKFTGGLAEGNCTAEGWQRFVVAHYTQPEIEKARRDLVRVSLSFGDWCRSSVPEELKMVATELRARIFS